MKIWHAILFGAIGVVSVSCKHIDSADSDTHYQAWCLSAIKEEAASHQNAILVLADECHYQRSDLTLDFKGTVVSSYKGLGKLGSGSHGIAGWNTFLTNCRDSSANLSLFLLTSIRTVRFM